MLILRALPLIHVLPSLSASPPSLGYVWLPTFPLTPHLPPPSALYGYSSQAPASETDLFTCRAVLQTLATANKASAPRQLAHAADLLEACVAFGNPELEASLLMHFCSLLVEVREPKWGDVLFLPSTVTSCSPLLGPHQALGRRSKALTALLKQRYSASLARYEVFAAYLMQVRMAASVGGGCLCQRGRCFTTLYRQSVTNLWAAVYNQ